MNAPHEIAELLVELADRKDMPVLTAIRYSGAKKGMLNSLETGNSTSVYNLAMAARYFNVSTDYLVGLTDNPEIEDKDCMMNCPIEVAEMIHEAACKKGLTARDAFERSGALRYSFDNMRRGQEPSAFKLTLVAQYLGVSIDYLLGRADNPEVNK